MHLETSYANVVLEFHGKCPNPKCGEVIAIPAAAVAKDGSHRGYCGCCLTPISGAIVRGQ
jgi:hypothetical protein